jgi:hypothetical protein
MPESRKHRRASPPDVRLESPLIDCRLVDVSSSGLGFETSVGLRLGVRYPVRLREGNEVHTTDVVVSWCRLVRNESRDGESRPVYRVGATFVDSEYQLAATPPSNFELEVDAAVDGWMDRSRKSAASDTQRTVIRNRTTRQSSEAPAGAAPARAEGKRRGEG